MKLSLPVLICSALVGMGCSALAKPGGERAVFTQQVDVFGLKIKATERVPQAALLHAANVMAEYLDNDEDGQVDNPMVLKSMLERRATLVMAGSPEEFDYLDVGALGTDYAQDLYADEVHPNGAVERRFDATLEEVWHLITFAGFEQVYPDTFGAYPDSEMGRAMDVARGGHFERVPRKYPSDAWYSYYDRSCDYECQAGEYFYWTLSTLLGAQDYAWRKSEIADEWRLTTPAELANTDTRMYALLTDPHYKLPRRLPDGRYGAQTFRVSSYDE